MPLFRKIFFLATLALAAALAPARACGPDFPNAYLAEGSVSLLNAPEGYFAAEIAKLVPADPASTKARAGSANESLLASANAAKRKNELTETGILRLELAKRGLTPARIDALAIELETVRANIFAKAWNKIPAFSADMPAEFAFYLNGAFAYWKGDFASARYYWTTLLSLPENERRHNTVNATYMLGRMNFGLIRLVDSDGNKTFNDAPSPADSYSRKSKDAMFESAQWLRKTREAAAAGFDDLSNLADDSLGWEARAWLEIGDYAKAIHLYMQQYALGDKAIANPSLRVGSPLQSLRITANAVLKYVSISERAGESDAATAKCLQALAQDELSRRVVTVFLLARFSLWGYSDGENYDERISRQSLAWAATLRNAELCNVPDADRIAWIAYQAGNFDMARSWTEIATQDSVPANWIRAKLALRDGNLAGGERLLEKVTASADLTGEARPVAWSELGRVRMSRGEYAAALDAFIHGGHWEDSAYIAERVLTLDELRDYIDTRNLREAARSATPPRDFVDDDAISHTFEQLSKSLCNLLARRLARANAPAAAVKYFSEELGETYAAYIADVREGFDAALPAEKRARAFWRAALAIRENDMELLGTELAPDNAINGGSYGGDSIFPARKGPLRLDSGPAAPTADELKRLDENIVPVERYHYRYRAAQLGMWAASLMPNDDDETAAMLNRAGGWLKNRDPKAANDFYRALVIRCPNTALGKAAAKKGWFADAD